MKHLDFLPRTLKTETLFWLRYLRWYNYDLHFLRFSASEPPNSCFQCVLQNWVNDTCHHHHHKPKRVIHLIFLFCHLRRIYVWTVDDKRDIVNEQCTKWKDRVQGVKFECTLGTTVKKNVPLRPGHGEIQNNCCWFIGEVADLNQLAHYNNTAKC